MKKVFLGLCGLAFAAFLSGCCMKHQWVEATCTEAKHCEICAKTEGSPLGHKWKEATCTTPEICELCGKVRKEAPGHQWVDRTMEKPKTCSVCGETEGSPITCTELVLHKINPRDYDSQMFSVDTMAFFNLEEGVIRIFDYEENELASIDLNPNHREGRTYDYTSVWSEQNNNMMIFTTDLDEDKNCTICIYNQRGELLGKFTEKVDVPDGQILQMRRTVDERYARFYASGASGLHGVTPTLCIDYVDMVVADVNAGSETKWYNAKKFSRVIQMPYCDNKYNLAISTDGTKVLYVHSKYYSVQAEYADASRFNMSGLALVSEKGGTYDLVDTDLNIIAKGLLDAKYADWGGAYIFTLWQKDGSLKFYKIQ